MRYADANVIKIKHDVLEAVARLAFAGELEERKDEIPLKLIRVRQLSSAAVSIRNGRLSGRECASRKEKHLGSLMTEM